MTNVDKALLLAEWSVLVHPRGSGVHETCPVCFRLLPPERSHDSYCAMDLALSERGFCTQEERDRARGLISVVTAPTLLPTKP